jgi:hypothetical protein
VLTRKKNAEAMYHYTILGENILSNYWDVGLLAGILFH